MEFIPDGFSTIEQVALQLAKDREVELWRDEALTPIEKRLYDDLSVKVHSVEIKRRLSERMMGSDQDEAVRARLRSFIDAQAILRNELFNSKRRAVLLIKKTGAFLEMLPQAWAQENAPNWFDDSHCFLEAGGTETIAFPPFIPDAPVETNFAVIPKGLDALILIPDEPSNLVFEADAPASKPNVQPAPARPLSQKAVEAKFAEWRNTHVDGRIPTINDDTKHMKQFGVSRDRVRELRRSFPSLRRGKPKATDSNA